MAKLLGGAVLLLLLGLAVPLACRADGDLGHTFSDAVMTLTDATFTQYTQGQRIMAMYYADWCGHCKRLAPTWSQAAEQAASQGIPTRFASVLATENRANPGGQYVRGYPTILLISDGRVVGKYDGGRTAEELVAFAEDFNVKNEDEIAIMASELAVAMKAEEAAAAARKKEQEEKDAAVAVEFGRVVPEVTDDNWAAMTKRKDAVIMYYAEWCGHCKRLKPAYMDFAANPGVAGLLVARVLATDQRNNPGSKYAMGYPTILYVRSGRVIGSFDEAARDADNLRKWAKSMSAMSAKAADASAAGLEAKLEEMHRRNREQEEAKMAAVMAEFNEKVEQLNDENFAEKTAGRDAFVMYYAEWCGHCKAMKPDWVKLAQDPAVGNLVVGAVLATDYRNNPGAELVEGFPTLVYFRDGVPVDVYREGDRSLATLKAYAEKMSELDEEQAEVMAKSLGKRRQKEKAERVRAQQEDLLRVQKAKAEELRKAKLAKRLNKKGR